MAKASAQDLSLTARLWLQLAGGFNSLWTATPTARFRGGLCLVLGLYLLLAMGGFQIGDASLDTAATGPVHNVLGRSGAVAADLGLQVFGAAGWIVGGLMALFGVRRMLQVDPDVGRPKLRALSLACAGGVIALCGALSRIPAPEDWPSAAGLGGLLGWAAFGGVSGFFSFLHLPAAPLIALGFLLIGAVAGLGWGLELRIETLIELGRRTAAGAAGERTHKPVRRAKGPRAAAPVDEADFDIAPPPTPVRRATRTPLPVDPPAPIAAAHAADDDDDAPPFTPTRRGAPAIQATRPSSTPANTPHKARATAAMKAVGGFELPDLDMLATPKARMAFHDDAVLLENARLLETVLSEFGVKGAIDQIRPGPVVTLYELIPAAGVKSARVVALSDDIARSMSARACRVSVVPGRNAIGIELPNPTRETVYLRDLLASSEFDKPSHVLPLALGKTIGDEPYVADLARMPHLLIAGTTGSGKSVGVNAMILSILYRLPPDECRFIMIDPKMLELSVYDGIPHLLAPVVTDPKKAVVALKWTVREMEDRYRRMSKIGVRNVASYNERAKEANANGEHFIRTVQTGFDDGGRPIFEEEKIRPEPMPYLVVVIDEMADLMLVAGKDIEGAVQRLAQMARAAGIHLIMATQRPSVDVITGTIKANFPTRISFQVTSKIDSRTILGEQGAEQLLGQGDMLYMAGGGRITRLHGPFVSDGEVEAVARYLRDQGSPNYLDAVTEGADEDGFGGDDGGMGGGGSGDDLYDRAVAIVTRDRKASTSYVQRRLQIGYNRAASLIEKMEQEGVITPANHAGKRDILAAPPP